jgi:ribose transport system permease protein
MATETAAAPKPKPKGSRSAVMTPGLVSDVLERGGLVILLVVLIIFFSIDSKSGTSFRSSANVTNILGNQSVTGIIALAMVVPLVSGYFDLSVAAVAGLANVTSAALMGTHQDGVIVGIVGALVISLLAGGINGFLVAGLKLNGFVVTLGTYTLIGGLLQYYTKGQTISNGIPQSFSNWGTGNYLGLPRPFWLLMVIAAIVWYVLMHTPFGRKLEGIGSNESAARLVGIRVDRAVFLSFMGSALLAGCAGVLLTSSAGTGDPTAGPNYLFPALAAVFLGATAIRPGRYNVWGTMIGVFLVAVAVDGFTLLGASSWVTPVFNGAALVAAVTISTLMGRRRESQARTVVVGSSRNGAGPDESEGSSRRGETLSTPE